MKRNLLSPGFTAGTRLAGRQRVDSAGHTHVIHEDLRLLWRCKVGALVEMAYWQGMMHADGRRTPRIPRREIEDASTPGDVLRFIYDFRREHKADAGFGHAENWHRDRRECSDWHPHDQPRDDQEYDRFDYIQHLVKLARRWSPDHVCAHFAIPESMWGRMVMGEVFSSR